MGPHTAKEKGFIFFTLYNSLTEGIIINYLIQQNALVYQFSILQKQQILYYRYLLVRTEEYNFPIEKQLGKPTKMWSSMCKGFDQETHI
jgi:hypothetical protein